MQVRAFDQALGIGHEVVSRIGLLARDSVNSRIPACSCVMRCPPESSRLLFSCGQDYRNPRRGVSPKLCKIYS
eukprot:5301113-Amphidinium_carterae.1